MFFGDRADKYCSIICSGGLHTSEYILEMIFPLAYRFLVGGPSSPLDRWLYDSTTNEGACFLSVNNASRAPFRRKNGVSKHGRNCFDPKTIGYDNGLETVSDIYQYIAIRVEDHGRIIPLHREGGVSLLTVRF